MNFKTIIIIILSVLITVIFMQNTDEVLFKILWTEIYVSKLLMMLIVTLFGFTIGLIIAKPKKKTPINQHTDAGKNVPLEINNTDDQDDIYPDKNKLSDEDRDYIS